MKYIKKMLIQATGNSPAAGYYRPPACIAPTSAKAYLRMKEMLLITGENIRSVYTGEGARSIEAVTILSVILFIRRDL